MTDARAETTPPPSSGPGVRPMAARPKAGGSAEARRDIIATVAVVVVMIVAMQIASGYVPEYIIPAPAEHI